MNKPKYEIGDSFTSSDRGDVTIIWVKYSDALKQFIYAVEYKNIQDLNQRFAIKSEAQIKAAVLEQDDEDE